MKFNKICIRLIPLTFVFAFLIYSFIHHIKHIHFLTFGWDLAVFDQPIWLLTQGQPAFSSLMKMHTLGDHFHPLLLVMGKFLYYFWSDPRILLYLQTLFAVLSGFVIYRLALDILKHRLLSWSISSMYIFSVAFQSMVLDDFHDDVMVTLPLSLTFYFLHKKNWIGFWISVFWVILTKEEYGLLIASIGLYMLVKKISLKRSLIAIAIGIASFFLLLEAVMPFYSQTPRYIRYNPNNNPLTLIKKTIQNPLLPIITLIDHPQKRHTLFTSVTSFGFLPLFSPAMAIPILQALLIRFIDATAPLRFEFNNHYNGPLITLLAISSIYASQKILAKRKHFFALSIWILAFTALQNIVFHGPVNSLFKPQFYATQSWQHDAHQLIKQVPQDATLATQNSLLPHLDQRPHFYLLPEIGESQYVAVDLEPGPNKFYGQTADQLKADLDHLINTNQYQIIWQQNKSILLKTVQ